MQSLLCSCSLLLLIFDLSLGTLQLSSSPDTNGSYCPRNVTFTCVGTDVPIGVSWGINGSIVYNYTFPNRDNEMFPEIVYNDTFSITVKSAVFIPPATHNITIELSGNVSDLLQSTVSCRTSIEESDSFFILSTDNDKWTSAILILVIFTPIIIFASLFTVALLIRRRTVYFTREHSHHKIVVFCIIYLLVVLVCWITGIVKVVKLDTCSSSDQPRSILLAANIISLLTFIGLLTVLCLLNIHYCQKKQNPIQRSKLHQQVFRQKKEKVKKWQTDELGLLDDEHDNNIEEDNIAPSSGAIRETLTNARFQQAEQQSCECGSNIKVEDATNEHVHVQDCSELNVEKAEMQMSGGNKLENIDNCGNEQSESENSQMSHSLLHYNKELGFYYHDIKYNCKECGKLVEEPTCPVGYLRHRTQPNLCQMCLYQTCLSHDHSIDDIKEGDTGIMNIDNLAKVYEACYKARIEWYNIGLRLIPDDVAFLDSVEESSKATDNKLRMMLQRWLQNGEERTWQAIIDALKHETVGRKDIADEMVKRF